VADQYRIDSHKIHLHPDRVAQWLEAVKSGDWNLVREVFPIYVEVSPVSYCNHRCTFCGVDYMLDRKDKPLLELDTMKAMFKDMAINGVKSVMLAGCGEPLLHKGLAEAIEFADNVGIDTSITTNGALLHMWDFSHRVMAVKRLRWIKVSIAAGDAQTYHAIQRGKEGDFDRVVENLARTVEAKRELGSGCTIGAQVLALPETYVVENLVKKPVPSNLHTIKPLAVKLREIGLDYLVVKPYSQHLMSESTHYQDVNYKEAESWAADLESMSTDSFQMVVRTRTMELYDADQRGYGFCQATPSFWAYVEADGNVWGCSTYLGREEAGKKYGDDRFLYGNVKTQSFSEIWRGERRRLNWEYVSRELDISTCRRNCRMHQVNQYLWELTHSGSHVNFI